MFWRVVHHQIEAAADHNDWLPFRRPRIYSPFVQVQAADNLNSHTTGMAFEDIVGALMGHYGD
jgi:hypothetical protein